MSDFQKKAAEAASRLAGTSVMTTPEESMSRSLAQDRPTMDAAIKSYLSLISARSLAQNSLDAVCVMNAQDALTCCRALLKAINQYTFALDKRDDESLERRVVAQLWDGLVASKQKPSRFLGRRALVWAYKDLELEFPQQVDEKQTQRFVQEFGSLLQYKDAKDDDTDNDGALLWEKDGGKQELARRRQRRADRAAQQQQEKEESQQNEQTPTIEELDYEDAV